MADPIEDETVISSDDGFVEGDIDFPTSQQSDGEEPVDTNNAAAGSAGEDEDCLPPAAQPSAPRPASNPMPSPYVT